MLAVGRWALGGMGRWDQEPWVEAKSGSIVHLPIYLDAAGCTRYQISLDVEMLAMQRGQGRRGGEGVVSGSLCHRMELKERKSHQGCQQRTPKWEFCSWCWLVRVASEGGEGG